MRINESYCGEAEQNGPLVGTVAMETTPIATYSSSQLTSVAATDANGRLVIFLGTAEGHLKKVIV
jgi:plexin A